MSAPRSPRSPAHRLKWLRQPLTVAAIHAGALLGAGWLAAAVVACGWPQAAAGLPVWAVAVMAGVAAVLSVPRVEAAFSAAAGHAGQVRRGLAGAVFSLVLGLAVLLSADAELPSLTLVLYLGLVLIADGARRGLAAPPAVNGAPRATGARLGTALDAAPYRIALIAALGLLVAAGLNYVLTREPNAERLANWAFGFLTLGAVAGLVQEFFQQARPPSWLRQPAPWLGPVASGALLLGAGLFLQRVSQPPVVLRGAIDPLDTRPAFAAVVRYVDEHRLPGDVILTRDLPVGLRCFGLQPEQLVELQPAGDIEVQVVEATTGRRQVFMVFPTFTNRNRRRERLALEQTGDLLAQQAGLLAVEVYAARPRMALVAGPALDADYGPLTALSAAHQPEAASGGVVGVAVRLSLNEQAGEDYLARLALLDDTGQIIASADDFLLNPGGQQTGAWAAGEAVEDYLLLPVPLATPPGRYQLALGFLGLNNLDGFPLRDRTGLADNRLLPIGEVQVTRPTDFSLDPYGTVAALKLTPANQAWDAVRLLGYRPVDGEVLPGSALPLLLHWEARQAAPTNQRVRLRLLAGTQVVTQAEWSLGSTYAADQWQLGEQVLERLTWQTPPDVPAGPTRVQISLEGDQWVDLGTITLGAITRTFEAPAVSHAAAARFGQVAELVGYDIQPSETRDTPVTLTLHWRAANPQPLTERYKVFVHAVGANGELLAQSDAEPAAAARPTTSWIIGEYVADMHSLTLPADYAGAVKWRVGLYDAATLARVPVGTGDFVLLPDELIIPAP